MYYGRGALLFFGAIHIISRSRGLKNRRFESNLCKITRPVAAIKSLRFAFFWGWPGNDHYRTTHHSAILCGHSIVSVHHVRNKTVTCAIILLWIELISHLAPVPLSIFRSNSKFDENSERSSFKYTQPITTIFCTRHDSDTVVTCAKYRCDRQRIFYTRVVWIFIELRIRSKYA